MKHQRWIDWTITGLMAALMLLSAIPDVLQIPGAVAIFRHLGYPSYLLLFLGTAKTLGVAAVLVPGLPKIKEWAFAGLVFDLTGAFYSHLSVGDPPSGWMPAGVGLVLVISSYVAYRKRLDRTATSGQYPTPSVRRGAIELSRALEAVIEDETRRGLDPSSRVVMRRPSAAG